KKGGGPFHSRLTANSAGTYLMSAGWVWQPYDVIQIFDLARAIKDPSSLDERITGPYSRCCEVNSAAFLDDDRLVLSSAKGAEDFERDCPEPSFRPGSVA